MCIRDSTQVLIIMITQYWWTDRWCVCTCLYQQKAILSMSEYCIISYVYIQVYGNSMFFVYSANTIRKLRNNRYLILQVLYHGFPFAINKKTIFYSIVVIIYIHLFILLFELAVSVIPVSYTHLDVYKRQV